MAEMTKQELIQAAKEIRKHCREHRFCRECIFSYINDEGANNACVFDYLPEDWDIERLERESNENKMG